MKSKLVKKFSMFSVLNCLKRIFSEKFMKAVSNSHGVSAILVMIFVPFIIYGISYVVKYTQKTEVETNNFEIPYVIGKNLANSFNPGKVWSDQEDYLYSVAAQVYNDGASSSEKQMALEHEKTIKVGVKSETESISNLCNFYANYSTYGRQDNIKFSSDGEMLINCLPFSGFVYDEDQQKISYLRSDTGIADNVVYTASKYKKDSNKLEISLNSDGNILVKCKKVGKTAEVTLPRNDVDIVIAIPTNRASNSVDNKDSNDFGDYTDVSVADKTPIKEIARACQAFLKPFLHTAGVAIGIIPYSGKVSLSPYMEGNIAIETPLNYNPSNGLKYAVQAMFYGSDGQLGGDVVLLDESDETLAYGNYSNWGSDSYGRPIMARRGQEALYRGMYLNSGAITDLVKSSSLLLDMTTPPTSGDNYKFMQMNTNPCYLGFCNTLAMTCEKKCPTYQANPYFITELTSDIQSLMYDLELFVPFKDEHNKSNFLFLPIVMAGNLLSWGEHPSELSSTGRIPEKSRKNKSRVVVVIANAPDNFEPMELTYLGFNNDYSEIPMIESDMILFGQDRGYSYEEKNGEKIYTGVKGAVRFSTSDGKKDSSGYLFKATSSDQEMTARISFPNKGLLKIVAERYNPATVTVYNTNGVEDNVGTYTFLKNKTLTFRGPQQVKDWANLGTSFTSGYYTTKGPNFGHNTSTKKVKIKFSGCKLNNATLSDQILRFYGTYEKINNKNQIGSRMDPCINLGSNTDTPQWVNHSSYIAAYGFNPTCKGISKLSKFIMAASCLAEERITDDKVKINSVSTGSGVKSSDATAKYRVYAGSSKSGDITVNTGQLKIASYYYYDIFASKKYRERDVTKTITTYRYFPATSANAKGSNNSTCCSTVWTKYTVPNGVVDTDCDSEKVRIETDKDRGSYEVDSLSSSCKGETYDDCTYTEVKATEGGYEYTKSIRQDCEDKLTSAKVTSYSCKVPEEYDCNCQRSHIYGTTRNADCEQGMGVWNNYKLEETPCDSSHERCGTKIIGGEYKEGMGCIHQVWETTYEPCSKGESRCSCGTCTRDKDSTCYKCTYNKAVETWYTPEGCERLTYETKYRDDGYKTYPCDGVCFTGVVSNFDGWTKGTTSKSMSCSDTRVPEAVLTQPYTTTESQTSSSCEYDISYSSHSKCTFSSSSLPSITYSYKTCGNAESGNSTESTSYGGWVTYVSSRNRMYAYDARTIDGENNGTKYYICPNAKRSNCSTEGGCFSDCDSTSVSTYTTNGTYEGSIVSPYRYKLYNFFFVDGGTKSSTYSYSGSYPDYTLTSTISSDSDSNLINNKGIYLLPTGEEDTYWVCFCGDAKLTLNFTDATEAAITFSNINPVQYRVDFGDSADLTSGTTKVDMDTQQIFYIHPDQILDTRDEDGNYYVDLKLNGQPRIISVELTNRPLKMVDLSSTSANGTIVGSDSSGSKSIGNIDTSVEFKLPNKAAYSFSAQPISFWIDGQSDFRETSGNVRVCSNSNKSYGVVLATVPDSGSGSITLVAGQPTVTSKQSSTGISIDEITPNYTYTISSDRKLKSIKVPSFVAPKVEFSGAVSNRNYTFCSKEVSDNSNSKLFDWPLTTFSHAAMSDSSGNTESQFTVKNYYGNANKVGFDLTACDLKEATAENLILQFSSEINDFPKVNISNTYNNAVHKVYGEGEEGLRFIANENSPKICGDLDGRGEVDCRSGYWLPWANYANSGYYVLCDSTFVGWQTITKFDITEAFNMYGQGTIYAYAYRGTRPIDMIIEAGIANAYYGADTQNSNISISGICISEDSAHIEIKEMIEDSGYTGINYLNSFYYRVVEPCNLMGSDHLSYSNKNDVNHNYKGTLGFHGIGDIKVYVQPQKVKASNYYTRDMSESELSGSFGNYKYTFSEQNYLLNLDDEDLTKSKNSFELLYSTGQIGTSKIEMGNSSEYSIQATTSSGDGYYYTDVNVENAIVTVPATVISKVGDDTLDNSQQSTPKETTFTISPYTHTYEKRSDGYYYVKIACRNVYISNLRAVSNLLVYYEHPNIVNENLINTRILDGYDQATNKNMKLYGNMNLNGEDTLPSVSAVQRLFYNIKTDNSTRYFYPRISESGSALSEEEGDFFIQIWDHNNEAPAVRWKVKNAIQSSTGDITVTDSGFGPFKSNYAFNGLHRMFFPYNTYNKDYAGYSYAHNSALVFAGYTLPVNYILVNNGYQDAYSLSSGQVSSYTKPNTALSNLAADACTRLKTDLKNNQGSPLIFLVKYKTDSALSLEKCADYEYSASNEEDLTEIMKQIALYIDSKTDELRINVTDTSKSTQ